MLLHEMKAEKRRLRERLEDLGYTRSLLKDTLEDIERAAPDIRQAIAAYAKEGTVENLAQPPVDVEMLMNTYGMNPIAALLFIDWCRSAPDDAMQCLALGIDRVTDLPEEPTGPDEEAGKDVGSVEGEQRGDHTADWKSAD